MDILFIITGILFSLMIPFFNYDILGQKGTLYYIILVAFAVLVLAYVILSVFKFYIARYDYLYSKKIVAWNVTEDNKKNSIPYYACLLGGVLIGCILLKNSAGLINAILIALACAFISLGWWMMGIKRFEAKKAGIPGFVLSHVGLIYNGKAQVFNGYTKGILNAEKKENQLILTILKNKKESQLQLEIPKDKISEVDAFLKDLNAFFKGEDNG